MALPINPEDPGEDTSGDPPGTPGYTPPVTSATVLAIVTTNPTYAFTSDQIRAAGGPWASFTLRVTPVNDNGSGAYQESPADMLRVTDAGDARVTEAGDMRIGE